MSLPLDVAVDGVVNGLVYALLAMGIVLVYRSTRVINFAAGSMGLPAAGLVALLGISYGVPYGVALAAALAGGALFGAVIELIVVRRLFTSPRVVVLVATIGIGQLALAVFAALPDIADVRAPFPSPITGDRAIADANLSGPEQTILLVVPAVAVGLGLLLTRTRFGRMVAATADNAPLSRLSGVSPRRISTLVWALAGLISSTALILIAADVRNVTQVASLGPATMSRALIAAVLAGMASFPRTVAAGVVIGVLEAAIGFNYLDQRDAVELVLLAAVILAVYLQSRQPGASTPSRFRFTPQVRPVPRTIQGRWWVRHHVRIVALVGVVVAAAVPLVVTRPSQVHLYTSILLFGAVALSASIVTGWSGQLSLGQMALAGLGALSAAALVRGIELTVSLPAMGGYDIQIGPMGLVPAAPIASAIAGLAAVLIGSGALRLTGLLLAVTTFVFAYVAQRYIFQLDIFTAGRGSGTTVDRGTFLGYDLRPQRTYYWLSLLVVALLVAVLARLSRRGPGRVIRAVRDNPQAAAAYGVDPSRTKLVAFGISGAIAGLAGALLGGLVRNINTSSIFTVDDSLQAVSIAVIGGLGSIGGPLLGAIWVRGMPALFPGNEVAPLLGSGIGLLVLLLYFPGGLVQLAYSARDALFDRAARRATNDDTAGSVPTPTDRRTTLRAAAASGGNAGDATPLVAENLIVRFGGNVAVNDVSLQVGQGEVIGLIGANGAGKSTVLNAVSGFVPAQGRISLMGEDVSRAKPHERSRRGLGRTFQAATLYPELTVHETVMVALEARRRSSTIANVLALPHAGRIERRTRQEASEYIDVLGLGPCADTTIAELSTGTRRIVEFAGLLALGARVLCLDEPTAGVAQRETEAFGPLLLAIRKQLDASVLIVEHDMPLIMGISDRIYCLESGRVLASGHPDEVRNNPAVIQSYLGLDEHAINRSMAPA